MTQSKDTSVISEPKAASPERVKLRLDHHYRPGKPPKPDGTKLRQPRTNEQQIARFWNSVIKAGEDECWLWKNCRNGDGYGRFYWNGKLHSAHRISYYIEHLKDPGQFLVLHTCDTPRCVNPKHLFLGTDKNNSDDMKAKDRERKTNGERHWKACLTESEVAEIKRKFLDFKASLASAYGISSDVVINILKERHWVHIAP